MLRQTMPHVIKKDNHRADLYFENITLGDRKKVYQDLMGGETIQLSNFGGKYFNTDKTLKWNELDEKSQELIKRFVKLPEGHITLEYDELLHKFYEKEPVHKAHRVIRAFFLTDRKGSLHKVISSYKHLTAQREFSCIIAPFPDKISTKIRAWGIKNIPEKCLVGDGLEKDVHVTVLYGLHGHDPYVIRPVIYNFGPLRAILGEISIFENENQDVVKISVESSDLRRLNKLIASNFEYTNSYSEYIPHVTLGYVKPGFGKKFVGRKDFSGQEVILDEIIFSGNDYRETAFSL